jgi:hypothetical protein
MQRVASHPKRDTQGAVGDEGAFILLVGVLRPIGDRCKKQHPNYCKHTRERRMDPIKLGPSRNKTIGPTTFTWTWVACSG